MTQVVVHFSKHHSSEAWRHNSLNICHLSSGVFISRLMVVSHKAKEEAASSAPMDSRLTQVSILQEQELWKLKMQ